MSELDAQQPQMADNLLLSVKSDGGLSVTSDGASCVDSTDVTVLVDLEEDLGRAAELATHADAKATRRAYAADARDWAAYAEQAGVRPYPIDPSALAAYVAHLDRRGLAVSTIRRRCAALSRLHRERKMPSPTDDPRVRAVLRGLARDRGVAPRRKLAMTPATLKTALAHQRTKLRDAAILALGFVTGLRRSELAALRWGDIEEHPDGLAVSLGCTKSDPTAIGSVVAVPHARDDAPYCPVRVILDWKDASGPTSAEMPLFGCSARTIARAVQRAARRAGLDPDRFGGHSLRAGLATVAAERGVTLAESMAATRHRSPTVAASYVRPRTALSNRAHRAAAEALADGKTP